MEPKIPAILSLLALMLACCSAFENGEQNSHIAEPYPHQRQFGHSRQSRQQLLILCTQYGFMPYPMDTTKYIQCIFLGTRWYYYVYNCPPGANYDDTRKLCVIGVATTPPAATTPAMTTPAAGTTVAATTPAGGTTVAATTPAGGTTVAATTPAGGTTVAATTPAGGTTMAATTMAATTMAATTMAATTMATTTMATTTMATTAMAP